MKNHSLNGVSGVYAIIHKESGKLYVGSAVNIAGRWRQHLHDLRHQRHHSRQLQRAWNKHGENAFAFVVVRFCVMDDLLKTEQHWLDEFVACGRTGYNSLPIAGSRRGTPHSPETRAKLSAAHKGRKKSPEFIANLRGKKHSPETIAKMKARVATHETRSKLSAALKGRYFSPEHRAKLSAAAHGRKHTRETIEKLTGRIRSPEEIASHAKGVEKLRGRKLSEEHRRNIALAGLGRTLSEETREKISKAHKGKKASPETRIKLSESHRGKTHAVSPEARAKIAASKIGVKRSPETIAKMIATKRAKKLARMSMVQGELFP